MEQNCPKIESKSEFLSQDAVKSLLEDRILSSKRETLSPEFKRRISGALRLLLLDSVKSMETTANGSLPDVFLRECIVMSQMVRITQILGTVKSSIMFFIRLLLVVSFYFSFLFWCVGIDFCRSVQPHRPY